MSTINFHINGTPLNHTMDVEKMQQRLTDSKARLELAIEHHPERADVLQDRIDKIDRQIERLNEMEGKDINLSPDRALQTLGDGSRFVNEGLNFLDQIGHEGGWDHNRLSEWADIIQNKSDHVDRYA